MNKLFKLSTLGAALFLTFGCNQNEQPTQAEPQAPTEVVPATADEPAAELTTLEQKAAYAIGASFSKYLVTSLNQPKELGINLEDSDVFRGIHDSFSNNVQLTQEEIEEVLKDLDKLVADKLAEYSETKQAEVIEQGNEYRENFKQQKNVTELDSGLMIQVHEDGRGKKPATTDTITVHYRGMLTDSTSFDSSYDRGEPATFPLAQVIEGWTEGLQHVNVGSKVTLVIPPELAYGDQSTPSIPGSSTLVFDIELLSIEK
ncbi:FKBP-type peptidyl-prolyl cis-trans isomerase [Vibrio sp. ZSDE26]|uniref:Peptidyl-prolyl cis-trans isomerase n=1 Tax=Vibrio amylolyticus TaxID=2847292 RepID=A0A9X2BHB8_9VIBR|nr:FKBP-type peptidyl-prolyl cis-trans isomerase [Vibrio amylolyticus]MCK6262775.1 FKBP-type peptidyl-prolyl cis-trans isomerase [Vibrio amylolyticus]